MIWSPAAVVIQTRMVNGPISELFKTVSTQLPQDWQEMRDRWVMSNIIRRLLATLAFFPRYLPQQKTPAEMRPSSQSRSTRKATKTRDAMPDFLFLFTVS